LAEEKESHGTGERKYPKKKTLAGLGRSIVLSGWSRSVFKVTRGGRKGEMGTGRGPECGADSCFVRGGWSPRDVWGVGLFSWDGGKE